MKLKLISDGSSKGTKVVNAETNEELENVNSIFYKVKSGEVPYVVMKVWMPNAELEWNTDSYEVMEKKNVNSLYAYHHFFPKNKCKN